jgi:hypothetical protein
MDTTSIGIGAFISAAIAATVGWILPKRSFTVIDEKVNQHDEGFKFMAKRIDDIESEQAQCLQVISEKYAPLSTANDIKQTLSELKQTNNEIFRILDSIRSDGSETRGMLKAIMNQNK